MRTCVTLRCRRCCCTLVLALLCRPLMTSPFGASCCNTSPTIVTRAWHNRQPQRWLVVTDAADCQLGAFGLSRLHRTVV